MKKLLVLSLMVSLLSVGCSARSKQIAIGAGVGGLVGASAGYLFVHHGRNREYETRNTIISGIIFSLLTAGVLAWHYRDVDAAKVEMASKFSRYTLCAEGADKSMCVDELLGTGGGKLYAPTIEPGQASLRLDEGTRWVLPSFRKRELLPERSEDEVISSRFVWEIVRPGFFATREQNPDYFLELESPKPPKKQFKIPSPTPKSQIESKGAPENG